MALLPTGYLDFTWNATPEVDGYAVKFYKNNTFFNVLNATDNHIRVTGLLEGDILRGLAYPKKDDNIFSSFTTVSELTVPIANFENSFSFNKISVDGNILSLNTDNEITSGQSNYKNGSANINFSIVNPRTNDVLPFVSDDPFLDSIYINIPSLHSTELKSFNHTIYNTGDSRNFTAEIAVNDYYGSGVTGHIDLTNDPISITHLDISYTGIENNQINATIFSEYSTNATFVEYALYDNNECTGEFLYNGQSTDTNAYIIPFVSGFSGAVEFTPHDWFGSGVSYILEDLNFGQFTQADIHNTIQYSYFENSDGYSNFTLYSNYINDSNSGSYFEVSFDSGIDSSFNSNSYFTGRFDNLNSGYVFDLWPHVNVQGESDNLYTRINLYQSGSNILEDSTIISGSLNHPFFVAHHIYFDYISGLTNIEIDINPGFDFTGIELMLSGNSDTDYYIHSGQFYETNELNPYLRARIVDSTDDSKIYDEIEISGSGGLPSVVVEDSIFPSADGFFSFNISNPNAEIPITNVRSYGMFSFIQTSTGTLPQYYQDILSFNNYLDFQEQDKYVGVNVATAPPGLTRTTQYDIPSSVETYESGLHYMYRFVPENGYTTGEVSEVFQVEFPLNSFTQYVDGNQQATDSSITNIDSSIDSVNASVNSISNEINNVQSLIPTGIFMINEELNVDISGYNIDYSIKNFSNPPIVLTQLVSTLPNSPVIYSQLSGYPSENNATVMFSSGLPNTGYRIVGTASSY